MSMRRKILSILSVILFTVISFNLNAQDVQIYLRGGLSDMTGFMGVEYFVDQTSVALGWHKFMPSVTDVTYNSIDVALYRYTGNFDENSWYGGIGYSSLNAIQTYKGIVYKTSGTFNIVGGYRFGRENFDVKIGGGYSFSNVRNKPTIDLSVGIGF